MSLTIPNTFTPSTTIASADMNDNMSAIETAHNALEALTYPADSNPSKAKVYYYDNTAATIDTGVVTLHGWGFITGNGTSSASATVTFGVTFTSAPIIVVTGAGDKNGTDPTSAGDTDSTQNETIFTTGAKSTTSVDILVRNAAGDSYPSSRRLLFHFIVMGQV